MTAEGCEKGSTDDAHTEEQGGKGFGYDTKHPPHLAHWERDGYIPNGRCQSSWRAVMAKVRSARAGNRPGGRAFPLSWKSRFHEAPMTADVFLFLLWFPVVLMVGALVAATWWWS